LGNGLGNIPGLKLCCGLLLVPTGVFLAVIALVPVCIWLWPELKKLRQIWFDW